MYSWCCGVVEWWSCGVVDVGSCDVVDLCSYGGGKLWSCGFV